MPEPDDDVDDTELARDLARLPLVPPPATLDARIAEMVRARPRAPRRWLLPAAVAAAIAMASWLIAEQRAAAIPAARTASEQAPSVHHQIRCWAESQDDGIVVVDGSPMRMWRTRWISRQDRRDARNRLHVVCVVSSASITLVSQNTL